MTGVTCCGGMYMFGAITFATQVANIYCGGSLNCVVMMKYGVTVYVEGFEYTAVNTQIQLHNNLNKTAYHTYCTLWITV